MRDLFRHFVDQCHGGQPQSGCRGSFVGRLDLDVEGGRITKTAHRLIPVDATIASEAAMTVMVDAVLAPHRELLGAVVGYTHVDLHRNTILEATMNNLLFDAIAEAAETTIAFSNGWRYGAPVPQGPITRNDLWNMIPTNPPVSTVDMTGEELWTMMEDNLERSFSANPYEQMGGYVKRCRGISIYAKIENPPGQRIERFFVDGETLDRDRTHTVAYVTMQAVPQHFGRNRRDLDLSAIGALERYLARRVNVSPALRGTVTAV